MTEPIEEPWSDADSLAAAIEAAPDTIDLRDAYTAEARMVLGEERVAELGWPQVGLELGIANAVAVMNGQPPPYPTTHEAVALATAKRLLRRYRDALLGPPGELERVMRSDDFRRDLDPSVMQFAWAWRAARAVLALGPVPPRPALSTDLALIGPRPMFE